MGSPRADDHSRYAWGRLYPNKMPVTAVHLMNNDVLPSFEAHGARIATVLSDNGREFCGRPDRHAYELFLQLEEIESGRLLCRAVHLIHRPGLGRVEAGHAAWSLSSSSMVSPSAR